MIVLDTHVWIWWLSASPDLSATARKTIDRARLDKTILISSISVWEVALLAQRKRLQLSIGVAEWIAKSESLPFFTFIPVDNTIAAKSVYLPAGFHGDPADRILVATALVQGADLVTKDERIRNYPHVTTIW